MLHAHLVLPLTEVDCAGQAMQVLPLKKKLALQLQVPAAVLRPLGPQLVHVVPVPTNPVAHLLHSLPVVVAAPAIVT